MGRSRIGLTIICRPRVRTEVHAALPARWDVSECSPEEVFSGAVPEDVWITDTPEIAQLLRSLEAETYGLFLRREQIELVTSGYAREPTTRTFDRSAAQLKAAVISAHLHLAEHELLKAVEKESPRLGVVVTPFVRTLLLTQVPDQDAARSRHRSGEAIFLRTIEEYADLLGCSDRHLQKECQRLGFTPSELRDLVLLRAVLEARLRLGSVDQVASIVGYYDGNSLRRAVKQLTEDRYDVGDAETVLEVIKEIGRLLGFVLDKAAGEDG